MNKTIENLKKLKSFHNGSYGADIDKAIRALEQQKTGHWIDCFGGCKCSKCGCVEAGYSDFCPNCGAKMERSDKE